MSKKFSSIWVRAIIVALICSIVSFAVYKAGIFDYLENKAYDRRMVNSSHYSKFSPSDEIVFIAVDQESLDWVYENKGLSWPWPREVYGNIVNFLSAGGVNSIMFDMLYTEPSIYGQEDDNIFGEAESAAGCVVQTIFLQDEKNGKLLLPVEPIKNGAAIIANVRSSMDKDDVIRRFKPFYNIAGTDYPSLGMAPLVLENEDFSFPSMAKDGTVRLRYQSSLNDYLPYKASDIIASYDAWIEGREGDYIPEDFEDTYVFFALYSPGLFDICSTPVSQVYPGVGVHITALDNYLQKDFIYDVPQWVSLLWFIIISLVATFFVAIGEKQKNQARIIIFLDVGLVLGGIIAFELPFVLFIFGINIPQVAPFISYIVSFALMFGLIYVMEGKQKRFIKAAFSQCLSKDVVNDIINDPSSFTLGGKKMEMSAIFTDIQKFSSFSELLTASQLGTLLNYYLTKMSDIIINELGTVDKYEGDAIVAMVGAPVQMKDHAARACRASIKMKKEEKLMNKEIQTVVAEGKAAASANDIEPELFDAFKILVDNNKVLFTRIGINSGEMIAGYFGSTLKKNYTIMGNNVNLASRLEGVNKQYSTFGILISEFTRKEIGDEFIVRRLDNVQVVNVNTPIQLYELLEESSQATPDLLSYVKNWEEAMNKFTEKKYPAALEKFYELNKTGFGQTDNVVKYYIHLIEDFFIKGKYPVEADDIGVAYNPELGVFKLLQK